ncbi:hypothetical protein AKJ09_02532 [Labilithrix luteola]|uniref:Lipoprotein n=1 Tax=Labilithrix luteola TaxID=1391654 RepID=A0A0K1PQR1_9BACT|nr:hypothetical protein [Labilithrix luteola]AKU95868.1 hypothetical protein AKJ09_02532 [Labilithrix luteola]
MAYRFLSGLLAGAVLLAACSSSDDDANASLVLGVQDEMVAGAIGAVHVVATVDGESAVDATVSGAAGTADALPKEFNLKGRSGARADVRVDAYAIGQDPKTAPPAITRTASTGLVAGTPTLLRIQLDPRCMAGGGLGAVPVCAADQSCVAGACAPNLVPFDQLEDYDTGWAAAPPDICRPARHGAPEVITGTGQTDYATLTDGQTLSLEKGPQGGHHVWIALRMKNLRQTGSRTFITAKLVDDSSAPPAPAGYVFTFERDEGAYCKLWGLRYQLDSGAANLGEDYKRFLGRQLEVTVEVADSTGAKASSTRTIQIANQILWPDGTTSCQ